VVVISAFVVLSQGPAALAAPDNGDQNLPGNNLANTVPTIPGDDSQTPCASADTMITATKTATGFWENRIVYDWSVEKMVTVADDQAQIANDECGPSVEIEPGESAIVSYTITADRSEPCVTDVTGVRGVITVVNTGCNDTRDLAIWDTVQAKYCDETISDLVTVKVDTSCHPILAAGESYDYSYEVAFEAVCDVQYCNVANVTITNFVGYVDCPYGVKACAPFALPDEETEVDIDDDATLTDNFCVPCGFTAEALCDVGPWYLESDAETCHFEFVVEFLVTNVEVPRDMTVIFCNQATLVPEDSVEELASSAQVTIFTGPMETCLAIEKTANVDWISEHVVNTLGLSQDIVADSVVEEEQSESPVSVDQITVCDNSTFVVCGTIKVTNTGECPTADLAITDSIQMEVCDGQWEVVSTVCVDTSCMPVLQPTESYCYAYTVTFSVDQMMVGPINMLEFRNVAFASITNYDDDSPDCEVQGVYYYVPLDMPLKADVITIETTACFTNDQFVPMGGVRTLEVNMVLNYEQTVVIYNGDDQVKVDVQTHLVYDGVVTYTSSAGPTSQDIHMSICHSETACMNADESKVSTGFQAIDYDNESVPIYFADYPATMDISGFLVYEDELTVYSGENQYSISCEKLIICGVHIIFDVPEVDA
jgi:hypothetical protein